MNKINKNFTNLHPNMHANNILLFLNDTWTETDNLLYGKSFKASDNNEQSIIHTVFLNGWSGATNSFSDNTLNFIKLLKKNETDKIIISKIDKTSKKIEQSKIIEKILSESPNDIEFNNFILNVLNRINKDNLRFIQPQRISSFNVDEIFDNEITSLISSKRENALNETFLGYDYRISDNELSLPVLLSYEYTTWKYHFHSVSPIIHLLKTIFLYATNLRKQYNHIKIKNEILN